jgi:hypothetical protein
VSLYCNLGNMEATLVLPVNPLLAFDLLVTAFEADGVAMENCLALIASAVHDRQGAQ